MIVSYRKKTVSATRQPARPAPTTAAHQSEGAACLGGACVCVGGAGPICARRRGLVPRAPRSPSISHHPPWPSLRVLSAGAGPRVRTCCAELRIRTVRPARRPRSHTAGPLCSQPQADRSSSRSGEAGETRSEQWSEAVTAMTTTNRRQRGIQGNVVGRGGGGSAMLKQLGGSHLHF